MLLFWLPILLVPSSDFKAVNYKSSVLPTKVTRERQDRALRNSARETKIVIRPQPQHIEESKKNVFLRHPYALRWRSVELFKKRTIVVITDYLIVGVSLLPSVLILFNVAPKKYQLSKSNNWNWSTFDLRLTDRSLEISFFIKLNFLLFETENRKGKTDNATYKLAQATQDQSWRHKRRF